ncbi:alpha,alpha-trehalase nth1 [Recurvomyces mirabilis]|uniref:Endonuclease III homolog n=1 Tax=Recurvomyces mirabilis TaxID=574656 RepID=A0AAE1BZJ5_9PEZI|nr:alpha,alpha-trehalase nth1 [Recurvomyces mirabilis]KAK5151447.1 alpha,alpha-trehalase nth1 [Recurvomyces mirabilis]
MPRRLLRRFAADAGSKNEDEDSTSTLALTANTSRSADSPSVTSSTGKRKRDALKPKTTTAIASQDDANVRRSSRKALKLEDEEGGQPSGRKAKRQPSKRIKGQNGTTTVEPPPGWEEVYDITAVMRRRVLAPVDTMGCEDLADRKRSPRDQRLQTLVALMLSSQTKDTVTAVAIKRMQEGLPSGFNLQSLIDVEPDELNRLIEKVGFHNNKTKFLKAVAIILRDKFDGDIPDTIDGFISLPGVGPKMAYLCMSAAWGRDEGIGVDVHVHRITNLWGWHKTSTPEQTRAELESWLPKEKWHDINHLLVGFGQTICLPVGRHCGECDLANKKLCPSAVASSPTKRRVKKEVEIKIDEDGESKPVEVEGLVVEKADIAVKIEEESKEMGNVEEVLLAGDVDTAARQDASYIFNVVHPPQANRASV